MRNGNFFYVLKLQEAFVVHRGVSQGGKKLNADQRRIFWQKNSQKIAGVDIKADKVKVTISLVGLRVLREKNLVIVSNPGKPRVWTATRIMESADKNQMMTEATPGASQRRGGLKL
jgi:hypothetical protein